MKPLQSTLAALALLSLTSTGAWAVDAASVPSLKQTATGFTQVYTVVDGFEGDMSRGDANAGRRNVNGWRNKGLPWGYALDKAKLTLGGATR